jgi:hypothetical protein
VIFTTHFNGKPLKRFRAEKSHLFTWLKPGANDGKLIFKNPAPSRITCVMGEITQHTFATSPDIRSRNLYNSAIDFPLKLS